MDQSEHIIGDGSFNTNQFYMAICSKMLYKLSVIGKSIQLARQWTQKYCYN